ncbi:hypothetical protein BMS3Bbin09_01345 [bacterium BMS3Bbin09]|nr:hypothetical protein BMS3Bbin09_01345 [bacterium BMS3Bbin09]
MTKYQNATIEDIIKKAAKRFTRTINNLHPAYNNNGFNEKNLTFNLSHEFAKRPYSNALMEIPFYNDKNKKHDNYFDAYLFDSEIGIFLESKRLINISKAKEIIEDLSRLNKKDNLKYIINNLQESQSPKKIFILVLAESWSNSTYDWWVSGSCKETKWDSLRFPRKMHYGIRHIKKYTEDDSLISWLYAYKQVMI